VSINYRCTLIEANALTTTLRRHVVVVVDDDDDDDADADSLYSP